MNQKEKLISIIGDNSFRELDSKIPVRVIQDMSLNYSDYWLTKSEQEILDSYSELINNTQQWTIPKQVGGIIILTNFMHDLLKRIVKERETDTSIIKDVMDFDLHFLIIFCCARYDIPDEYFIAMMELKQFRNMISHDFNSVMDTSFHESITAISKGSLLMVVLVQILRNEH